MTAECKQISPDHVGPSCGCSGEACALKPLYHVPRSQVWEGSRGRQRGHVHLHVTEQFDLGRIHRKPGDSLCGKRGWYERDAEGEALCPRCESIRDRAAQNQETRPDDG